MPKPVAGIEVNHPHRTLWTELDGRSTKAAAMELLQGISGESTIALEVAKENPKAILRLRNALEKVDKHLREIRGVLEPEIRTLSKLVVAKERKQ